MARQLDGRTAVVTGSTSGIGKAIAERFAAEGANVMLNGFGDAREIEAQRAGLEKAHGVKVSYHGADMTKPAEIAEMMREAGKRGPVQILVNNAGIQHVAPVEEFPPEKWDAIIAINLSSAFHTTRAALPAMKQARWGRIINIASVHGLVASEFKSAYVSAKHGLVGFTKTVALEVAEAGITCNAICPGFVYTSIVDGQIDAQARLHGIPRENVIRDVILAPQPTKQFVRLEDVASLSLYLASDAAAQINGAALSIDGGWSSR